MRNAVDLTVTGRVQGVSFRYYAEREATRPGRRGGVRPQPAPPGAPTRPGAPGGE